MDFFVNSSLITPQHYHEIADTLSAYIDHLQFVATTASYEAPECSINLVSDAELLQQIKTAVQDLVSPQLKYIIDIGIGGSNLGTKAIYDAFFGYFDILETDRFPKIIFLDTTDPEFISKFAIFFKNNIHNEAEVLINAISKSGGTTETIANLEITLQLFSQKFPTTKNRVVITTDKNSKLWHLAVQKNIKTLEIPAQVGGRYSVFSAVGLFPLAAVGIDIEKLLSGAREMRNLCLNKNFQENPALASAATIFLHQKTGKTIHDTFIFHPELESLGKWYRQLMGESIGKEKDLDGNIVHSGVTPTVSIGSTDLHSVGQLYLGGPRDKVTTFIYTEKNNSDAVVPSELEFSLVDNIAQKSFSEIMRAICQGTKTAYAHEGLPFMEVVLHQLSAKELGAFLQFKMIEMMFLGKLLHINAFDQPHVELYKVETKKILQK